MVDETFTLTLYDDESVKEKLKFMSKWDAMLDDARNPETEVAEKLDDFLRPGKTYRIRIVVEEN